MIDKLIADVIACVLMRSPPRSTGCGCGGGRRTRPDHADSQTAKWPCTTVNLSPVSSGRGTVHPATSPPHHSSWCSTAFTPACRKPLDAAPVWADSRARGCGFTASTFPTPPLTRDARGEHREFTAREFRPQVGRCRVPDGGSPERALSNRERYQRSATTLERRRRRYCCGRMR